MTTDQQHLWSEHLNTQFKVGLQVSKNPFKSLLSNSLVKLTVEMRQATTTRSNSLVLYTIYCALHIIPDIHMPLVYILIKHNTCLFSKKYWLFCIYAAYILSTWPNTCCLPLMSKVLPSLALTVNQISVCPNTITNVGNISYNSSGVSHTLEQILNI